ncbi:hypothetical protein GCM10023333_26980 [Ferrimonas pelagia]|uniref:Transposase n=1 Tax=Ferrimonas pelagia TaxID=1177826 RepID=A0ABP9F2V0_9GAMM
MEMADGRWDSDTLRRGLRRIVPVPFTKKRSVADPPSACRLCDRLE